MENHNTKYAISVNRKGISLQTHNNTNEFCKIDNLKKIGLSNEDEKSSFWLYQKIIKPKKTSDTKSFSNGINKNYMTDGGLKQRVKRWSNPIVYAKANKSAYISTIQNWSTSTWKKQNDYYISSEISFNWTSRKNERNCNTTSFENKTVRNNSVKISGHAFGSRMKYEEPEIKRKNKVGNSFEKGCINTKQKSNSSFNRLSKEDIKKQLWSNLIRNNEVVWIKDFQKKIQNENQKTKYKRIENKILIWKDHDINIDEWLNKTESQGTKVNEEEKWTDGNCWDQEHSKYDISGKSKRVYRLSKLCRGNEKYKYNTITTDNLDRKYLNSESNARQETAPSRSSLKQILKPRVNTKEYWCEISQYFLSPKSFSLEKPKKNQSSFRNPSHSLHTESNKHAIYIWDNEHNGLIYKKNKRSKEDCYKIKEMIKRKNIKMKAQKMKTHRDIWRDNWKRFNSLLKLQNDIKRINKCPTTNQRVKNDYYVGRDKAHYKQASETSTLYDVKEYYNSIILSQQIINSNNEMMRRNIREDQRRKEERKNEKENMMSLSCGFKGSKSYERRDATIIEKAEQTLKNASELFHSGNVRSICDQIIKDKDQTKSKSNENHKQREYEKYSKENEHTIIRNKQFGNCNKDVPLKECEKSNIEKEIDYNHVEDSTGNCEIKNIIHTKPDNPKDKEIKHSSLILGNSLRVLEHDEDSIIEETEITNNVRTFTVENKENYGILFSKIVTNYNKIQTKYAFRQLINYVTTQAKLNEGVARITLIYNSMTFNNIVTYLNFCEYHNRLRYLLRPFMRKVFIMIILDANDKAKIRTSVNILTNLVKWKTIQRLVNYVNSTINTITVDNKISEAWESWDPREQIKKKIGVIETAIKTITLPHFANAFQGIFNVAYQINDFIHPWNKNNSYTELKGNKSYWYEAFSLNNSLIMYSNSENSDRLSIFNRWIKSNNNDDEITISQSQNNLSNYTKSQDSKRSCASASEWLKMKAGIKLEVSEKSWKSFKNKHFNKSKKSRSNQNNYTSEEKKSFDWLNKNDIGKEKTSRITCIKKEVVNKESTVINDDCSTHLYQKSKNSELNVSNNNETNNVNQQINIYSESVFISPIENDSQEVYIWRSHAKPKQKACSLSKDENPSEQEISGNELVSNVTDVNKEISQLPEQQTQSNDEIKMNSKKQMTIEKIIGEYSPWLNKSSKSEDIIDIKPVPLPSYELTQILNDDEEWKNKDDTVKNYANESNEDLHIDEIENKNDKTNNTKVIQNNQSDVNKTPNNTNQKSRNVSDETPSQAIVLDKKNMNLMQRENIIRYSEDEDDNQEFQDKTTTTINNAYLADILTEEILNEIWNKEIIEKNSTFLTKKNNFNLDIEKDKLDSSFQTPRSGWVRASPKNEGEIRKIYERTRVESAENTCNISNNSLNTSVFLRTIPEKKEETTLNWYNNKIAVHWINNILIDINMNYQSIIAKLSTPFKLDAMRLMNGIMLRDEEFISNSKTKFTNKEEMSKDFISKSIWTSFVQVNKTIRNEDNIIFDDCYDTILNECVVDATNELIFEEKIYGDEGEPLPWSIRSREIGFKYNEMSESKRDFIIKIRNKLLNCLDFKMALIPENHKNLNTEEWANDKERKYIKSIKNDWMAEEGKWRAFETEETQMKLVVSKIIMEQLLNEVVEILEHIQHSRRFPMRYQSKSIYACEVIPPLNLQNTAESVEIINKSDDITDFTN